MANDGLDPTLGFPLFDPDGVPSDAADLQEVAEFAARRGTRIIGTTEERLAQAHVFNGLQWYDTTLQREFRYGANGWAMQPRGGGFRGPTADRLARVGQMTNGDIWFDTDNERAYAHDGASWQLATRRVPRYMRFGQTVTPAVTPKSITFSLPVEIDFDQPIAATVSADMNSSARVVTGGIRRPSGPQNDVHFWYSSLAGEYGSSTFVRFDLWAFERY